MLQSLRMRYLIHTTKSHRFLHPPTLMVSTSLKRYYSTNSDLPNNNNDFDKGDTSPLNKQQVIKVIENQSNYNPIDSFFGGMINSTATVIKFSSGAVNTTLSFASDFGSGVIKSTTSVLTTVSPQIVDKDTKILPDIVESSVTSTLEVTKTTTKYLRDTMGTITGLGAVLGSSIAHSLPDSLTGSSSTSDSLETTKAIVNLTKAITSAFSETLQTVDNSSDKILNSSTDAIKDISKHVLGHQAGNVVSLTIDTSKDLYDTYKFTSGLSVKHVSEKLLKDAGKSIISSRTEKKKKKEDESDSDSEECPKTSENTLPKQ